MTQQQLGRPRDPAIDEAILRAVEAVVRERGFAHVTVDEIAARANVPKSTIYRRYDTKRELLLTAIRTRIASRRPLPDNDSLRDDLIAFVRGQIAAIHDRDLGMQIAIAATDDPELASIVRELAEQRLEQVATILRRGEARGELKRDVSHTRVIEVIGGAAWVHFLQQFPFDEGFADEVVDLVLEGIRA